MWMDVHRTALPPLTDFGTPITALTLNLDMLAETPNLSEAQKLIVQRALISTRTIEMVDTTHIPHTHIA